MGRAGSAKSRKTRARCPIQHSRRSLVALSHCHSLLVPSQGSQKGSCRACLVYRVLPGLRLAWKQGGGTWTAAPHAVLSYPWTPLLPQRLLFQLHNQKVNGRTLTFFFIVLVSIFARRDYLALCAEQCTPNECCSGLQRCLAGSVSG